MSVRFSGLRFSVFAILLFSVIAANAEERVLATRTDVRARYKTLLSLDGGGLRSYMTNQILVKLEELLQEYIYANKEQLFRERTRAEKIAAPQNVEVHLADFFDGIAGVSSGSWIALYYASRGERASSKFFEHPEVLTKYPDIYRGSAKGANAFFEEYGGQIYHIVNLRCSDERHLPNSIWSRLLKAYRRVKALFGKGTRSFDHVGDWQCPVYSEKQLEKALGELYGDTKLSELYTSVLIFSYEMQYRAPVVFTLNNECKPAIPTLTFFQKAVHQEMERPRSTVSSPVDEEKDFENTAVVGESTAQLDVVTYEGKDDHSIHYGADFYIRDIGRASSALPVYHIQKEMHPIADPATTYKLIDGSMVLPDPLLPSLNFLFRLDETKKSRAAEQRKHIDVAIMSLGTGSAIGWFDDDIAQGVEDWILTGNLHNLVVNGRAEALHSSVEVLLKDLLDFEENQYLRIQIYASRKDEDGFETDAAVALDRLTDWEYHDTLKALGRRVAEERANDLKDFIARYLIKNIRPT